MSQSSAKRLLECVPNFSEGIDMALIKDITNAIESVEGIKLLNVDPGAATNRTVVTFVGEPEAVVEAAFRAVKKAGELIDMTRHHGAHPRIGATDVLPLVPVSGITLAQAAQMARELASRISAETGIPTYCYEQAATRHERRNLAVCRAGEYEGLEKKISTPDGAPDFGEASFTPEAQKSGATVVGARDFLVAVNYNLNTTSIRRANAIAFDVREKGRSIDLGEWELGDNGLYVRRENGAKTGEKITIPGTLRGCKAIGWYIDEYGIAQVSMNITNISQTPLHVAFEQVSRAAAERGMRVTGTQIVGLVPLSVLTEAGRYFLKKQQRSIGVSEKELVKIAIISLGLNDLAPFNPRERVIEYLLEGDQKKLVDMTCEQFAEETASESPAPGGGSISAYMGVLAASLGTMVANLSSHKAGWDHRWEFFSDYAHQGQLLMAELMALVDEDTAAFNKIMDAFSMSKSSDQAKAARTEAIQTATLYATQVPLRTMQAAYRTFDLLRAMVEQGNPNSVSDAGVGALAARSAVLGAGMNVRINAIGLKNKELAAKLIEQAKEIGDKTVAAEKEIMKMIETKI